MITIRPLFSRLLAAPILIGLCLWAVEALGQDAAQITPDDAVNVYGLEYDADFQPETGQVRVRVTVDQSRQLLREVRFKADPSRYHDFNADGQLDTEQDEYRWLPSEHGGSLSFRVTLDHRRDSGGFDSILQPEWAVFRGDDLFPPVTTRALKGAESSASIRFSGPPDWSFITAWPRKPTQRDTFLVDRPSRKFDRPVGWMAAGNLGIRWEDIDGTRVAFAGPVGHGIRRLDMAAFLRWNLPSLREVFPGFPNRLLVVSAADPMWRGGLSGPGSLFIHADRPLISGNGTSTLIHELVHVAQGYRADEGDDWIVEAIAEYYSLELMRRSGTLSQKRFEAGLDKLASWSTEASEGENSESTGAQTARGVAVIVALDSELREVTGGRVSFDDVAATLSQQGGNVSLARLRAISEELTGTRLGSLPPEPELGR